MKTRKTWWAGLLASLLLAFPAIHLYAEEPDLVEPLDPASEEAIAAVVAVTEDLSNQENGVVVEETTIPDKTFVVSDLKVEQLNTPQGIDTPKPRFSWKYAATTANNETQSAYQLSLLSYPNANEILWTSGKIESDQQSFVPYTGEDLEPGTAYYVNLTVWNGTGEETDSIFTCFSTGLWPTASDPNPWKGKWIGLLDNNQKKAGDITKAFWIAWEESENILAGKSVYRRSFDVADPASLESAVINFTGDNKWDIYLNGERIFGGTEFKTLPSIDILDKVKPGKNVIALDILNYGETANPSGCAGIITLIAKDGTKTEIPTDTSWKSAVGSQPEWLTLDFDDSAWENSFIICPVNEGVWGALKTSEVQENNALYLSKNGVLPPKSEKEIRRAVVYIVGLGYYELFIDGEKVGDHVLDPILTDYDKRVAYNTYDVTEILTQTRSDFPPDEAVHFPISVVLGNGRFFAPRMVGTRFFGLPRLLFQLDIEYADGTRDQIVSDESWKMSSNGPISENNDYDGEICDMRKVSTYRDNVDHLYYEENENGLYTVATPDDVQVVSAPLGELVAPMMPPMRVTGHLQPISVNEIKPGTFIFDFGQNFVGWVRIRAEGPAGTAVNLRFAETLIPEGEPDAGNLYVANLRTAKARDIFILGEADGPQYYHPRFTYHGFRYVEVTGYPGTPTLEDLTGCVVGTDMEQTAQFSCSNDVINQVFHNIVWGIRGNYLSMPTDCPQRDERQGWLGDRAAGSKGEMFIFNNETLYKKWMRDIEESQLEDGNVSDVCPNFWQIYNTNATWPTVQLTAPESLYLMFGDKDAIVRHQDSRTKWLNHLATFIKPDGTLEKDNYGDWCVPPERKELIHSEDPARKTNPGILATAYYAYDLLLNAKFADMLERPAEAAEFRARAEAAKNALNNVYYNKETGRYDNGTQTSCVIPLYFGLVPDGEEGKVFQTLVNNIENVTDYHIGTGLIGCQWLNRVLSDNGRIDLAYRIATNETYPSWGYMADHGATTIWELWNGDTADPAMNSGNHVMLVGDEAIWYFEYLAGIKADETAPGFKRILMRPNVVGDLKWVSASYESVQGPILSEWRLEEEGVKTFDWTIEVPINSTAALSVPTADPASVHVFDAEKLDVTESLEMTISADGRVEFELGSGQWEITSPLE